MPKTEFDRVATRQKTHKQVWNFPLPLVSGETCIGFPDLGDLGGLL